MIYDLFRSDLAEFAEALDAICASPARHRNDEIFLGISYAHALSHLCAAWHLRWAKTDLLSPQDFRRITSSLPNWGHLRLIDLGEMSEFYGQAGIVTSQLVGGPGAWTYLGESASSAKDSLGTLSREEWMAMDVPKLAALFLGVLEPMCLSWHSRNLSAEGMDNPSGHRRSLLARAVPNWNSAFILVPIAELST